jgi:Tol biopolymer transport system component
MIAFVSDRDGISRIWLKQVAGGGEAPLTEGNDHFPRYSPDGSQILFMRETGRQWDLYRTSVVGAQVRRVLSNVVEGDWSPDGAEVAFLRMQPRGEGNRTLVGIADVQTGDERILNHIDDRLCFGVRWSPDGRHIAVNEVSLGGMVSGDCVIDLIDVASGRLEHLSVGARAGPYTPVDWAPDGKSFITGQASDVLTEVAGNPSQVILFDIESGKHQPLFWALLVMLWSGRTYSTIEVLNSNQVVLEERSVRQHLHEVPWAGDVDGKPRKVLTGGLGRDRQPHCSPEGDRIIFSSNRSGNVDLWTVNRRTGALRQLTDDPANDWDPAFSPDGRSILWSSDRSGNMEIWMAAADGSRARQVTDDGVDAENPTMTPDGEWIVYASANDAKQGVWKIRPDGSDAVRLAEGSYLVPDVSPDGRFAAFTHRRALGFVIRVLEVETGEILPFEIDIYASRQHTNITYGRSRWRPDGQAILYIGTDEQGRSGVFVQEFDPGADTSASRRVLAGCSREFATESLDVTPDGESVIIAAMFDLRSLKLAEHLSLSSWD